LYYQDQGNQLEKQKRKKYSEHRFIYFKEELMLIM